MSNENNNNPINEEESLSPTVLAVVNALNGANGSDIGRVTRMMNASQTPSVQYSKTLSEEYVEESSEESDVVYVDIYEENGRIVEIDNVVVFYDDPLPGIETIEKFLGVEYANDFISEAAAPVKKKSTTPVKKASTTPVKKTSTAPVKKTSTAPVNIMANQGNKSVVQANAKVSAPAPAPAGTKKTKTKTPTPASKRTDAATKKEDKPSKLAADIAKRAKETKLDTGNLDLDISDKLKATDKVVDQNIKDAAAKLKPGKITKPSLLNRVTGGKLGKGATYTPGDVSAFDDSTKDFTKKVTDTAAQIKAEREKKAAAPVPAPKDAKQPWETTGSEPAPTDGGKDVLDQLDKDTTATGGGTPAAPGDEGGTAAPSTGGKGIKINYKLGSSAGADIGKEAFVKKQKAGDIKSTQVVFNLKDAKTGQKTRSIKPGDPEYADFMARYKKIPGAVLEALIRAGAILTEEGWYLNGQLIEDVQLDYTPPEFETQYYYDAFGNLRMMSEEDFAELSLAEAVVEMQVQMELEEELIGKQHKIDANKNNKIDAEDFELLKKKKTMKEESSEEETEIEQVEEEVEQIAPAQRTNWPWRK